MSLLILIAGIALLLILIMGVRMSSLLALIIASLFVGVAEGIPFDKIFTSIENGMGGTLGGLSMIIAFGTMLGKLLLESGAAQRIHDHDEEVRQKECPLDGLHLELHPRHCPLL